jgi:hypothetical protein
MASSEDDIVHLNVGGKFFITTKSTLTKGKHSYLYNIVENPKDCIYDIDGRVFINRPWKEFTIILDLLRCDGALILPSDELAQVNLKREVEFYGLKGYFEKISPFRMVVEQEVEENSVTKEETETEEEEEMIPKFTSWKLFSGSKATISKDGMKLIQGNSDALDRSFGDLPMKKPGKYYFEILLKKLSKGSGETYVGITSDLKNTSSKKNITMQLGGTFRNNCTGNCKFLVQGDTIGVLVDFSMYVVKFFTNGQYNGVSGSLQTSLTYYAVCHYSFANDEYIISSPEIPNGH